MKRHFSSILLLLFLAFALTVASFAGCTKEQIDSGPEVCFEADVLPLLQSNCTRSGCHNAGSRAGDVDLSRYETIVKLVKPGNFQRSELYTVLVQPAGRMPQAPYADLSDDQITTIARWIEQGARQTTDCQPACDTSVASYSAGVQPILERYCLGCHSGNAPQGNISLSSYPDVHSAVLDGTLAGSVNHFPGYSAMPQGGAKLSDCNLAAIERWIAAGALNN